VRAAIVKRKYLVANEADGYVTAGKLHNFDPAGHELAEPYSHDKCCRIFFFSHRNRAPMEIT
jgi:hypothetical protein